MIEYAVITVRGDQIKHKTQEEIYGSTRSNMSMVMNKGVKMHWKSSMAQVFTVVGLIVELSTAISKTKGYIE